MDICSPVPRVHWLRNSLAVHTPFIGSARRAGGISRKGSGLTLAGLAGVVSAELVIEQLGRGDLHSELTCQASNNNRSPPLNATVHVDMNCE
ncbi:hypothetical protein B566_EDAN004881 [Ephemera danica]|nr:hypothetical protein B566_EDAN004881 [Ephemera danica]